MVGFRSVVRVRLKGQDHMMLSLGFWIQKTLISIAVKYRKC